MTGQDGGIVLVDEAREGERECPVCHVRMTVETKQAISIDVCDEHGVWLDKGELDAIVTELQNTGRRRRRAAIRRKEAEQRAMAASAGSGERSSPSERGT